MKVSDCVYSEFAIVFNIAGYDSESYAYTTSEIDIHKIIKTVDAIIDIPPKCYNSVCILQRTEQHDKNGDPLYSIVASTLVVFDSYYNAKPYRWNFWKKDSIENYYRKLIPVGNGIDAGIYMVDIVE